MVFIGFAAMMFDAPGSEHNAMLVTLYAVIVAYPLGLIGGIISSWIAYKRRKFKLAYILNAIPLLWILPIVGLFVYANTMA